MESYRRPTLRSRSCELQQMEGGRIMSSESLIKPSPDTIAADARRNVLAEHMNNLFSAAEELKNQYAQESVRHQRLLLEDARKQIFEPFSKLDKADDFWILNNPDSRLLTESQLDTLGAVRDAFMEFKYGFWQTRLLLNPPYFTPEESAEILALLRHFSEAIQLEPVYYPKEESYDYSKIIEAMQRVNENISTPTPIS